MGTVSMWASESITRQQAETFATTIPVSASCRRVIADTLSAFPVACQVRGMFFEGLVDVVVAHKGNKTALALQEQARVGTSRVPFSLYPHRDFYKLYFLAAATLHPGIALEKAMGLVAETFYPVFRSSMVGKTMSALMGNDPARIMRRLSDAYRLSVPANTHRVEDESNRSLTWQAKVEPIAYYPVIFAGIVSGTMKSHGVSMPRVDTLSSGIDDGAMRARFRVSW